MTITAEELLDVANARYSEAAMVSERNGRVNSQSMGEWKQQIEENARIFKGDIQTENPDGTWTIDTPIVQNIAQSGLRDLKNQVSESYPTILVPPKKQTTQAIADATLKQNIYRGYWDWENSEQKSPKLAMDLAGAGAAFLLSYWDQKKPYPCHRRLKPIGCYPTFYEEQLIDLLYVELLPTRTVASLWPELGLLQDPKATDWCEVADYFNGEVILKMAWCVSSSTPKRTVQTGGYSIYSSYHGLGVIPVAWAKDDAWDDRFEGMFDQLKPKMELSNRIIRTIADNADRQTYAPRVGKGVLNPNDFGPDSLTLLDPALEGAMYAILAPPNVSPQLFQLAGMVTQEGRKEIAYPASRGGEVSQSIASAAYIAATEGEKSSVNANIQRKIAWMREQQSGIDHRIDKLYLDKEKSLMYAVGNKDTYTPSKDLDDDYTCHIVYTNAGVNALNASTLAMQKVTVGLYSKRAAMSQDPQVSDPDQMMEEMRREQSDDLLFQKAQQQGSLLYSLRYKQLVDQGKTNSEIVEYFLENPQEAQEVTPPTGPEGRPPDQVTAGEQQLQLQKGATNPNPAGGTGTPPFTAPGGPQGYPPPGYVGSPVTAGAQFAPPPRPGRR